MARDYSKNGCLTCKQRKKKCTEEKPTCASCRRLTVRCEYPDSSNRHALVRSYGRVLVFGDFEIQRRNSPAPASASRAILPDQLKPVMSFEDFKLCLKHQSLSLHAFLELPFTRQEQAFVGPRLYRLLEIYTEHVVPFRAMDSNFAMFRGVWWEIMMQDQVSSMCLAGICATFELNLLMPDDAMISTWMRVREKARRMVIDIIRRYIGDPSSVDLDQAILGVANLMLILAAYQIDAAMLRDLAAGLEMLVNRGGGLAGLVARQTPKFLLNILRAACNASLVSEDPPIFAHVIPHPKIPASLESVIDMNDGGLECSTPELQQMVKDMRLLLYFRCSPEQSNLCHTAEELLYLINLANYVDLRQCYLQSIYRDSSTWNKCLLLALILGRWCVLGDSILKPGLTEIVYTRLLTLIGKVDVDVWVQNRALDVLLWILILAQLCSEQHQQRPDLLGRIIACVSKIYDNSPQLWPPTWKDDTTLRVESFLWHKRLDKGLQTTLHSVQAICKLEDTKV